MRHPLVFASATALLAFAAISPASADIPNPANSTVPPCYIGCPFGDIAFTVVVRDAANNPQPNSNVILDFSTCTGVTFCVTQEPGTTVNGKIASRVTDFLGVATFHLHSGGLCPGSTVHVFADGVPLALRPVVSTDQDGNLLVDATDATLANAKVGGSDLSADFDCDGDVDAADLAILSNHQSHACDLATPTLHRTWGQIKVLYR